MRDAGPEIHRAGIDGPFRRIVDLGKDQYQRRENDEVLDRIVMREHQASGPLRMRLGVARWIGHRAGEATNLTAIYDVGDPQQSGENDRQRQPEQFARHRLSPQSISNRVPAGTTDYTQSRFVALCADPDVAAGRVLDRWQRLGADRARRHLLGVDGCEPFAPVRPPRALVLLRALEPIRKGDVLDIV